MAVGRMGTSLKESATDKPNSSTNPIFVSPIAPAGGPATEIVDQGQPNAGGSLAWPVSIVNPTTGLATEATLEDVDLDVEAISTHLTDGSQRIGGTTAVSAAALPLPAGAGTEATLEDIDVDVEAVKTAIQDGSLRGTVTVTGAGLATEATLEDVDVDVEAVTTELQVKRRPSQGTGRTRKKASLQITNGNALLYTVTAGKTLYLTSMLLVIWNTSAAAGANQDAEVDILDGTTAAGGLVLPIAIPPNAIQVVAGLLGASVTPVAAVIITPTFPEPIPFATGMYLKVAVGNVRYTAFMIGYEE